MTDIRAFIGAPLLFENKLKIYPPQVKQVISNQYFGAFYKTLGTSQEDIDFELKNKVPENQKKPTPFEYLLTHCQYIDDYTILVQAAFEFFCRAKANFDFENKKIILQNDEIVACVLSEENFFDFQNMIRTACGNKTIEPPAPFDPNEDPRIRRIKEKAKERDRIKAKQGEKNGISLTTCLTAICCMGIGITPLNIGEMSYAAIGPLMKMSQEKEKYDIDIRSLLAGADSKKVKPKYWIRNFNE